MLLAVVLKLHLAFGKGEGDGGVCGLQTPMHCLRTYGFAEGMRGCQCSSRSVRFSDLSFQGRLTAFFVNNFTRSVGVRATARTTRRMRQGLRWLRAAARTPRTGTVSPEQRLWRGWKSIAVLLWSTPSLWDETGATVSPALRIPPNLLSSGSARASYLEERTLPFERLSQPAEREAAAPEHSAARRGEQLPLCIVRCWLRQDVLVPQMSCESPGFPQEMSRDSADAFQ